VRTALTSAPSCQTIARRTFGDDVVFQDVSVDTPLAEMAKETDILLQVMITDLGISNVKRLPKPA
jgi:hypothetical protein